jgi:hypothetical protein
MRSIEFICECREEDDARRRGEGRRREDECRMSDAFSTQRVEPQGSSWTRQLYIENLKGERENYLTIVISIVVTIIYEKASPSR